MNQVFVISDTHFGHKKVIEFQSAERPFNSIEEHDEELVKRWNETVGRKDTVWHLGDVLFGRASFRLLERLNGVKKLVMGNHDHYPTDLYLEHFSKVVGSAEVSGCILTHIPIHPDQFRRYRKNIHGHLHSKLVCDHRYVNVSADVTGLRPVLLKRLTEELAS